MRISDWSSDVCSADLQLGEPINLAVAHLEHAAGILEHRARLQFSEGDDLRDLIAAVFLLDVADHLATPGFAEVDVEIGHRYAFGVQDAFEIGRASCRERVCQYV